MPSFSATDRAPTAAGITPLATSASHPSAAAVTLSNQVAINSAVSRGTSSGDGGVAPCTSARTGSPTGTSGTPTSASRSVQSGGAHTSASAPSARNRTPSAASGSTPPRESYVDNSTRIPRLHFRSFVAVPCGPWAEIAKRVHDAEHAGEDTTKPNDRRATPGPASLAGPAFILCSRVCLANVVSSELSHDDRMHDLLLVFPARTSGRRAAGDPGVVNLDRGGAPRSGTARGRVPWSAARAGRPDRRPGPR